MTKRIIFDVDGVLADFVRGFTSLAKVKFGKSAYTTLQQPRWDFDAYSKEEQNILWEQVKTSPTFWQDLDPLVDRITFGRINYLHNKGHEVYFVTSRPGINAKIQTEVWLIEIGYIDVPTVITTSHKGEFAKTIDAHFSIDDKAENSWCVAWLSPNTKSYLLDRPYNQYDDTRVGSSKITRVFSVNEYLDAIERE